jgi:hypothetical protein
VLAVDVEAGVDVVVDSPCVVDGSLGVGVGSGAGVGPGDRNADRRNRDDEYDRRDYRSDRRSDYDYRDYDNRRGGRGGTNWQ